MSVRFESFLEQNFNRISQRVTHFYQTIEPKVKKVEARIRSEFHKYEHLFDRFRQPTIHNKPVGLFFNLPPDQQRTVVKVGNARLRVRGSFHVFQKFIQKLIEHEAQQAALDDSETSRSHLTLAKSLMAAKVYVDDACSTLQTIGNFYSEIQNHRNQLLLKERTVETANQLEELEEMLAQLSTLFLPEELNLETVEAFSKETRKVIANIRAQFAPLQERSEKPTNQGVVVAVANQAQVVLKKSVEEQKLFSVLLGAMSQLKAHLFKLVQLKEQLFQKDLSGFTNFNELQNYVKSAQERQQFIKELELEVLILMDKNPSVDELHQGALDQYLSKINELVKKHEATIQAIKAEIKKVPSAPQKAAASLGVSQVRAQSKQVVPTLTLYPSEVSDFHQKREELIAQQKAKFRFEANAIVNFGKNSELRTPEAFEELVEVIAQAQEKEWNNLNNSGRKCTTLREVSQWHQQFHQLKNREKDLCQHLEEVIKRACTAKGSVESFIPLAKELVEQIMAQGAAIFGEFSDKELISLKNQFESLRKNSRLTLKQLQDFIENAKMQISNWKSENKVSEEILSLWSIASTYLTTKLGVLELLLKAYIHDQGLYFKALNTEKELFLNFQDKYVSQRYDFMYSRMREAYLGNALDFPVYQLERLSQLWEARFKETVIERQALSKLLEAEEMFANTSQIAKRQLEVWQENFQKHLTVPLQKMLTSLEDTLQKRKSLLHNQAQIDSLIKVLNEGAKTIEDFINNAQEISLPELVEKNENSNPALAKTIYDQFIKKIHEDVSQFKNLLAATKKDVLNVIHETELSIKALEDKIKKTIIFKDPQAQRELEIQSKCLFNLKDLTSAIDYQANRLSLVTQISDVTRMSVEKMRAFAAKVEECLSRAKEEISDKISKDPILVNHLKFNAN